MKELKDSEDLLFKWSQQNVNPSRLDEKLIAQTDKDKIKSLPTDMRNPIILPRAHQLVNLLLLHLHEKIGPCGYNSLIYEARKRFLIIGLRSAAKFLTEKCVICRKL